MPPRPMLDRSKHGPFDDLNTPVDALQPLLHYLHSNWVLWESAPGQGKLSEALRNADYLVDDTVIDFFVSEPAQYDCIVTNPPYSKKIGWLERCVSLNKPWVLLLPVTTLGVRGCQKSLIHTEIIFLPKRIDFTGKKVPWFAVAWFTFGLELPKEINFAE